jgi:serine O-acetyltransferase
LFTVDFPHPIGIVIASGVVIGKKVTIYQNVTIGRKTVGDESSYPVVCDNVIVYAGAVLIGNITIGARSIIGANAIVSKSVPPDSVVVGYNSFIAM